MARASGQVWISLKVFIVASKSIPFHMIDFDTNDFPFSLIFIYLFIQLLESTVWCGVVWYGVATWTDFCSFHFQREIKLYFFVSLIENAFLIASCHWIPFIPISAGDY